MMKAVSVSDPVSRALSDDIFSAVDYDNSGVIDQDEFLSWCFSTHHLYSGGASERLRNLDQRAVVEYFKKVDANGNGQIDHHEFHTFLKTFAPEAKLGKKETDKLFNSIDTDRSGEIDAQEFLRWVFPSQTTVGSRNRPPSRGTIDGKGGQSMALVHGRAMMQQDRRHSGANNPDLQAGKQEPVVFEFTIGPDFELTANQITKVLTKEFSNQVKVKTIVEPKSKGCRKLVVPAGRGIVLWDRNTMIMHHDDPFVSMDSSRAWVLDMTRKRLPTLMRAVNMK
jgi:Ca2+-binding EF-hand superfamily protein